MAATTYEDSAVYNKYLNGTGDSGDETCDDCPAVECDDCCLPGLVSVADASGKHIGCLTPNDAEVYLKNTRTCETGYVMLIKEGATVEDNIFLGCVDQTEFGTLYESVNGGGS